MPLPGVTIDVIHNGHVNIQVSDPNPPANVGPAMQQALSPYLGMAATPSTLANMQHSIYNVLTTPTPQLEKFNPITGYFEAKNQTLDKYGSMVGIFRLPGETDSRYRDRIRESLTTFLVETVISATERKTSWARILDDPAF